jgi:hypothetical protein
LVADSAVDHPPNDVAAQDAADGSWIRVGGRGDSADFRRPNR